MFKKLKQRLEDSVDAATSAVTSASGGRINLQKSPESQAKSGDAHDTSDSSILVPLDNSGESHNNVSTAHSPGGELINLQDDAVPDELYATNNSHYVSASTSMLSPSSPPDGEYDASPAELPITPHSEHHSRSRTSSFSSVTSDASIFAPVSFSQRQYVLPSDAESEVEDAGPSLNTVSKEDLYRHFLKMQRRSEKYRGKFGLVVNAYKELEKERDKLKNTLTQCQDKAFRRISELKEQVQLDQLAKQHIEENYALMMDEKHELIKVLHTQVRLLKEGKEVPEELVAKATAVQQNADDLEKMTSTPLKESNDHAPADGATAASNFALKDKVKRLEILLGKCKDTIRSNKERMKQLTSDQEEQRCHLEERDSVINSMKESHKDAIEKLRSRMKTARAAIEELETSKVIEIAEAKQQMHSALEESETELAAARDGVQSTRLENEQLLEVVEKLKKAGQDQLEKSREIIRQLKEEKRMLEEEMKTRIDESVGKLEEEREGEIQELKRGKVEALRLMQQQMEERIAAVSSEKDQCLAEKDRQSEEKFTAKEKQMQERLTKEMQKTLESTEEDMKLAIEERELQKMAALSQSDAEKDGLREQLGRLTEDVARLEKCLQESRAEQESELAVELSKLLQDKENLIIKSESEQKEFEFRIGELTRLTETLEREKTEFEAKNEESLKLERANRESEQKEYELRICELTRLTETLEREKTEVEARNVETSERLKEVCDEKEGLIAEVESVRGELTEKTATYEESLKLEREKRESEKGEVVDRNAQLERELREKIEELARNAAENEESMRQRGEMQKAEEKECDSSNELRERLSAADETILELRDTIQKLRSHELELNSQLDNGQSEYDGIVAELKSELERSAADHDELKTKMDELNTQLQNVQSECESSTVSELNMRLQDALADHDSKVSELNEQLESQQLKHEQTVLELHNEAKTTQESASEHSSVELEQVKSDYESKLAAANERVAMFEQRVNSLIERENFLNTELDQVKNEYETRIAQQSETLASMQTTTDMLKNNEVELRSQLESTRSECQSRIEHASAENRGEVASLQSLVETNQSALMSIISELETSKAHLDRMSMEAAGRVTEKEGELDVALNRISELEEEVEKLRPLEASLAETTSHNKDLQRKLSTLVSEHEAKVTACDLAEEKVVRLEQSEGEARSSLADTEEQRQCLENKMSVLEVNLSSEDEMVLSLKNDVSAKERKIVELEACVASEREVHGNRLSNLENQLREKLTEIEREGEEMDSMRETLQQKTTEIGEKTKLFEQLRQEAKVKIHDLKSTLQERDDAVKNAESDLTETQQAGEAAMQEMELRFAAERGAFQLDHQAEVKMLNDRLDKEGENMTIFKDNVRKQFDQRQEQTKVTINKLKACFQETAKDNEDVFKRKFENLEKQKDKERKKVVNEVEQTMAVTTNALENSVKELKAQLTTAEERLEEIRIENQTRTEQHNLLKEELEQRCDDRSASLTSEIGALESMNLALNEQFKTTQSKNEELHRRNDELESDCSAVREKYETELQEKANLVQELEKKESAAREAAVVTAQSEQSGHLVEEQMQTLNAALQDANVSLSDMKLEHDRLLKETENNIAAIVDEKLRAAETWKAAHLEECSKALEERNSEIVKLQEKLEKFKTKVQVRLKEHEQIVAEKDKCLTRLQETCDLAAGEVKTSNSRVAELDDKVAELIRRESELESKLEEIKNQLVASEGNVERVEKMVGEGEGKLLEEQEAVAGARRKVEELEAEMVCECERKKEELDAIEKQWQDKFAQLKQKYLAKLKEFQTQREMAEKTSRDRLELVEARNAEIEAKLLESTNERDDRERNQTEVMERLAGKDEEVKRLNGKILELENHVTKIQGETSEKAKSESAKMECRISEQQGEVSKMEAEMGEKDSLIASLRQEKETLYREHKELVCAHEEEKERLQREFAARLKSAESVIEESIQKSESGQHTEVKLKVLVTNLKREKQELDERISQLEKSLATAVSAMEDEKKDREVDNRNSEMEKDADLGRMRDEYETRIQDTEADHGSKVKQLLKSFNVKMTEKDKEFQDTYDTIMEKSSREESRLLLDHKEEMEELHTDLNERDDKIEQLDEDLHVQLQAAEELANANTRELQEKVASLEVALEKKESEMETAIESGTTQRVEARMRQREEEMEGLSAEWQTERQSTVSCDASRDPAVAQLPASQELVQQTQATMLSTHSGSAHTDWLKQRVIELTRNVEELKIKHKLELAENRTQREMKEGQLPQPLLAASSDQGVFSGGGEGDDGQQGSEMQQLELYNMNLQAQVIQQSGENAKLKIQERELRHKIAEFETISRGYDVGSPLDASTMEMEYLRNIIYEYMLGRETKTLCKVITTVLQFSDEQTRRILEKEEINTSAWLRDNS